MQEASASTLPRIRISNDTWLIADRDTAGRPVHSMVVAGREPVIVDTGVPMNRQRWIESAFAVVDADDVRWIFLSHADADHVGNVPVALQTCPNATVVTARMTVERLRGTLDVPRGRVRLVSDGGALDVGDRTMVSVMPPFFDAPETLGLFDCRSGIYWAADCLSAGMPIADPDEVPREDLLDAIRSFHRQLSPWHRWLDAEAFGPRLRRVASLGATAAACAHGPPLRGALLRDALDSLGSLLSRDGRRD